MNPTNDRNLLFIVALATQSLEATPSYSEWLRKMRTELPDCYLPLNVVWSLLPDRIEREFVSFCEKSVDLHSADAEIEALVKILWKWDRLDHERRMTSTPQKNRTPQPWVDAPGPMASSFRERAISIRDQRFDTLRVRERQRIIDEKRTRAKRYTVLCVAGLVLGWILSPLGWPSVILFLISLGYLAWSLRHKKHLSFSIMTCMLFLFFLTGGISRDLLDDVQPTAECRDGWYSYSANRSGTCSYHGGVAAWGPSYHHWWQSLIGQ